MSKRRQIVDQLHHGATSDVAIAREVQCHPAYVRSVRSLWRRQQQRVQKSRKAPGDHPRSLESVAD